MTNQTLESVIAEVIEADEGEIGFHWDGCYKFHAGCLSVKLRDMLREPQKCRPITNVHGNKPYCPTHQPYTGEWPCEYVEPPVIDEAAASVAPQAETSDQNERNAQ